MRIKFLHSGLAAFTALLLGGATTGQAHHHDPVDAPACATDSRRVAAGDERLRYSGRWTTGPDAARVSWAGATVQLRFRGTGVAVDLDPGPKAEQFRVVIDGEPVDAVLEATPGRQRHVLAAGLDPDRPHRVQLMKETYYGEETTLHGFVLEACEVLPPPPAPPRRIAFFGDSNMDGTSLYDEKDRGDSGAWFAYPAIAARMLDAEFSLQAFGGATLTDRPGNNVLDFITAPRRDRPDPDYRDGFEPQVIVVNAGANDIATITNATPEERKARIKERYRTVVDRLRSVYGEAPHILLYNAYGWHREEPAIYTGEVAAELGGALSVLPFPWQWEQFHGAMAEHGGQARHLAEAIAARVDGFEVVASPDTIDGWARHFDPGNGGFEAAGRGGFEGFGWRYAEDGVERFRDPEQAFEGEHFIRLEAGEKVHQGMDATGDLLPGGSSEGQRVEISARVRAVGADHATAKLQADFEAQAMYGRGDAVSETFDVGPEWTEIRAVFTAPAGSWKTFVTLAAEAGTVDFDAVRGRDPDAP